MPRSTALYHTPAPSSMARALLFVASVLVITMALAGFSRAVPVMGHQVILEARVLGLGGDFVAMDPEPAMFIYVPEWENCSYLVSADGAALASGVMGAPMERLELSLVPGEVINNLSVSLNGSWVWGMSRVYVIQPSTFSPSDFVKDDFFLKIPPWEWEAKQMEDFSATAMGALVAILFMGWRAMVHYRDKSEPEEIAGGKV